MAFEKYLDHETWVNKAGSLKSIGNGTFARAHMTFGFCLKSPNLVNNCSTSRERRLSDWLCCSQPDDIVLTIVCATMQSAARLRVHHFPAFHFPFWRNCRQLFHRQQFPLDFCNIFVLKPDSPKRQPQP